MKQLNAIDFLIEIMEQRNWLQEEIERRKAGMYKTLAKKAKLSYEKSLLILS
jgi:hypothetical protein